MRLSEAMRLGALLHPQCFGDFHVQGGSCALGAACDAVGLATGRESFDAYAALTFASRLASAFPVLARRDVRCPVTGQLVADVGTIIIRLNDLEHWTREQIADWVETLEPAETPDAADHSSDVRATESLA
jgi:hypothetical protein